MSNILINSIIALIEERPQDAREMLRGPDLKISITDVQTRLDTAIYNREREATKIALKQIMNISARIDVDKLNPNMSIEERDAFVEGITHLENIIYGAIAQLEA